MCLGGDEDVPVVHFKKHYRLTIPVIPDNLDRYRHIIRVSGITNVAVFGGDGVCVFNEEVMGEGFPKVIDGALERIQGPDRKADAFVDGGTVYPPAVKEEVRIVHERMASLAAGSQGELHLAYCSDESGSNDVILRSFAKGVWGNPVSVGATKADEYAPTVVALGKGQAMVAYVSNEKGLYDIHAVVVKDGKPQRRQQLTRSRDDAMAPVLRGGDKTDPWLVWYEWAKMGNLSRDREVFAARLRSGSWSKPIQVSPRDVPTYEDHADPVVFPDGKGGAWVAWAWDYHGTLKKKVPVDENSIFARQVTKNLELGEVLAVGYRGEGRARDYAPTLAVTPEGMAWVAWDNSHKASLGYDAKAIFVNRLEGKDFGEQVEAAVNKGAIDSPRLLLDPKGGLNLVWCQEAGDGWELWSRKVAPGAMGEACKLAVKGKKPRYPTGCYASDGKLWVTYTEAGSPRWEVRVESVD